MLLNVEDLRQTPELIALAVNLTQNQRNAHVSCPLRSPIRGRVNYRSRLIYSPLLQVICANGQLDMLMSRAFQTCDELIWKVFANLPSSLLHSLFLNPPLPMASLLPLNLTSSCAAL